MAKAPYSSPVLTQLGKIADLTRGSAASGTDGGTSGMHMV